MDEWVSGQEVGGKMWCRNWQFSSSTPAWRTHRAGAIASPSLLPRALLITCGEEVEWSPRGHLGAAHWCWPQGSQSPGSMQKRRRERNTHENVWYHEQDRNSCGSKELALNERIPRFTKNRGWNRFLINEKRVSVTIYQALMTCQVLCQVPCIQCS